MYESYTDIKASLYNSIMQLPGNQYADDISHNEFIKYLSAKLSHYTTYNSSWSLSIFEQFYEKFLDQNDILAIVTNSKDYVYYFTVYFCNQFHPFIKHIQNSTSRFLYKEILHILDEISRIDIALDFVTSLSLIYKSPSMEPFISKSIVDIYNNTYKCCTCREICKRLCQTEASFLILKHSRHKLPLFTTDLDALKKPLRDFENMYNRIHSKSPSLASSIKRRILPILNDLIFCVQNNLEISNNHAQVNQVANIIRDITNKFLSISQKEQVEDTSLEIEVNLKILKQISESL